MRRLAILRYATATVLLALGVGAAHAAPTAPAPAVSGGTTVESAIAEASSRFAIPPGWIRAVMQVESGGNPHALSPKGAIGLMQIMPATWAALRQRYHLGSDPYDPHDNILGGTALLRELYDRFGAGGFLAAYNAGPSRYLAFLTQGLPLKVETQLYLAKLARLLPEWADRPRDFDAVRAAGLAQRTAVCRKLARIRCARLGRCAARQSFRRRSSGGCCIKQPIRAQLHRVSRRTPLACSLRSRPRCSP